MYAVAVLAEQPLSPLDAAQVAGLHDGLDEPVRYHLLVPGNPAAAAAAADLLGSKSGHESVAEVEPGEPLDALTAVVQRHQAAEVIVLTGSHPLREALHRDWASQARHRLGLPTLHLLEHETFDEQSAGLGEGNQVL